MVASAAAEAAQTALVAQMPVQAGALHLTLAQRARLGLVALVELAAQVAQTLAAEAEQWQSLKAPQDLVALAF
jgi:hypothetical protein